MDTSESGKQGKNRNKGVDQRKRWLVFFSMIFNLNFLYVLVHSMNNLKIYLKTKKERKKAKLYAENKGGVHVI